MNFISSELLLLVKHIKLSCKLAHLKIVWEAYREHSCMCSASFRVYSVVPAQFLKEGDLEFEK